MWIGATPIRWRSEDEEVFAQASQRTSISFAAGSPEPTVDIPISMASSTPVFATQYQHLDPGPWLAAKGIDLVGRLQLEPGEQLLVATNVSALHIHERLTSEGLGRVLAVFASVVESLPPPLGAEARIHLPPRLKSLEPLVERWAIRDDEERAEAVGAASVGALLRLCQGVEPLIPVIDSILAGDGDLDPGARAAGYLAMAALEARTELDRRGSG